jgi:DNA polymerase III epsilon subunit-like protein
MFLPYRFISLDLETTGLSPETDTIIEIAAIAFDIELQEDGTFERANTVEKTMLIDPGRPLLEEVTMITGITESMLEGKQKWDEVRERVRAFFDAENTVIVGHNVLFDTAMLRTHGIDLTHLPTLDTFELSEILSQDQASLNLGFLSDAYGLSSDGIEHRALGDTRLAMDLLLKYLSDIYKLPKQKQSIFWLMAKKEQDINIQLVCDIVGIDTKNNIYIFNPKEVQKRGKVDNIESEMCKKEETIHSIYSIWADPNEEYLLLRQILDKYPKTDIVTMEKKTVEYLYQLISWWDILAIKERESFEWISFEEIDSRLEQLFWERKLTIMMGKILFWLESTKTGLLEELKFYGKEYDFLSWFRLQDGETHAFYEEYINKKMESQCVLSDISTFENRQRDILIIKDIPLLEEKMRRKRSIRIDFEKMISYLKIMGNITEPIHIIEILRFIEWIYYNIPNRPQWENLYPPGNYWETYYISQSLLWHRGHIWLSQATMKLASEFSIWKNNRNISTRHDKVMSKYIDTSLNELIQYHTIQKKNQNIILEIQKEATIIHIIEREIWKWIEEDIINKTKYLYSYGYGVWGEIIQTFLRTESGISEHVKWNTHLYKREILFESSMIHMDWGDVILTTSLKHIREIGILAKKTGKKVLMQGISGGKGKIMSIFEGDPENSIIIGLIDTWRDEYKLWERVKKVIIAKIPFDPPTDPYYLARTVGMKNNFSLYSEPMVIIRMNTLIGRIRSSGFKGKIFCTDNRIQISEWWKWISKELL